MKSLCLVLILAISATAGCSHSSASRQERAYAKYVKKSKSARDKRQAAFRKEKSKIPAPGTEAGDQQEMTQTSQGTEGPQSVPSEPSSQ